MSTSNTENAVSLAGGELEAVRTLAAQAREDLFARVERLLREEAARFDALLDEAAPEAESFARLHGAVESIRRAA